MRRWPDGIAKKHIGTVVLMGILLSTLTGCGQSVDAPAQVTAVLSDSEIVVTWTDVEGANGYRLYRRTSEGENYKFVSDLEQNCYQDSDIASGGVFSYRVQTIQNGKLSEETESLSITIQNAPEITSLKTLTPTEVEVKWSDTSAVFYRIYAEEKDGEWSLAAETADCTYLLRNAGDYTAVCIGAVYQTNGTEFETQKSKKESILRGCEISSVTQLDQKTTAILFESEREAGTQEYLIFRSTSPDGEYTEIGRSFEPVFYDVAAESDTQYYYRVQLVNDKSEGLLSEAAGTGKNTRQIFGIPVFMYHEFVTQTDLDSGVSFDEYAIWRDEFESDLVWLRDNGYTTITTAQLAAWLRGTGTLPDKPVMLTIDDGKYGVYKNAWPLLQQYDMTAVLAVIGEEIDAATRHPNNRPDDPAPFCTWDEIGEMSRSGTIEIISHSYTKHRFHDEGRQGANLAENEEASAFLAVAQKDYLMMDGKLKETCGTGAPALAYPYSIRSATSDQAWMECGYSILLAGDSNTVRTSCYNYYIKDAGLNYYSALTRRMPRMTGTPIGQYIADMLSFDQWEY